MAGSIVGLAETRLNLFEPLAYLDSTHGTYTLEVPSKTSLDGASLLEWTIEGDSSAYTDLYSSAIYIRAKVVKGDGTNLVDADKEK